MGYCPQERQVKCKKTGNHVFFINHFIYIYRIKFVFNKIQFVISNCVPCVSKQAYQHSGPILRTLLTWIIRHDGYVLRLTA